MPYLFEIWAHAGHQLAPEGAWRTWVILGGRGAGKTRAGAEWIRAEVEGPTPLSGGRSRRVALVAETIDEARDVMVLGESGLLACSPPDRRPVYSGKRGKLLWPNGAEAALVSAFSPEKLRGPQFDCAWADELGKWTKAREAWDMLQLCLRLGDAPRAVVTTTPRRNPLLSDLVAAPDTAVVAAPTAVNKAHLAPGFLEAVTERFGGTAQGRQELDGELVIDHPGALWTRAIIEANRVDAPAALSRVVVAVDPPASQGEASDECGIVVVGLAEANAGRTAYVLADRSLQGASPQGWARRVVAAYHEFEADRIVAEANQGGVMVETVIRHADDLAAYRAVYARRGKRARAEPVSALYEQGRVRHVGALPELEDQMCAFGAPGAPSGRSPDRVDALVWAITELVLTSTPTQPRMRSLG